MKYDDASWHFGAKNFGNLLEINGYTHTGTFLAWTIINGLAGEPHAEEWPEEIEKLKFRKVHSSRIFPKYCDGKFTDKDQNDPGNKFAQSFFEEKYFGAYAEAVDPEEQFKNIYEISSSWETYN